MLILNEHHVRRVLRDYTAYFNGARPHQGTGQQIPDDQSVPVGAPGRGRIIAASVLGGLHHDYRRAA